MKMRENNYLNYLQYTIWMVDLFVRMMVSFVGAVVYLCNSFSKKGQNSVSKMYITISFCLENVILKYFLLILLHKNQNINVKLIIHFSQNNFKYICNFLYKK